MKVKEVLNKKNFIYSLVTVLVILFFGIASYGYGSIRKNQGNLPPSVCGQCHSMQQQVLGWRSSGHKDVTCQKCHTDIPFAAIVFKFKPARVENQVKLTRPVTNKTCLACHQSVLGKKMPGDMANGHQAHLDKKLDCVDCHTLTGHSPPGTSLSGPFKQTGGAAMIKCLSCHNGTKALNKCETCHSEKKVPDDHKQQAWGLRHGGNLTADANKCNKCHGYDTTKGIKGDFKTFDLSKTNSDGVQLLGNINCGQCHYPGHEKDWDKKHIPTVKAQGPAKCQTCHTLEGCASCHRLRAK